MRPVQTEQKRPGRIALVLILAIICSAGRSPEAAGAQQRQETPAATTAGGAEVAQSLRIRVDATAASHPISPYIYGLSGAPYDYMAELNIRLNNWGGNPNTRYNWKLGNAWNAARDWYYTNGDYGYTGQSASDDYVRENMALGAASHLTIPTIGWVAKDTRSCSFPQPGGGCGNAGGAFCEQSGAIADPHRTSVATDPAYMVAWIEHLKQAGLRVEFLAMDNEPDIWGTTHYDVHPDCTTYDEIYEQFVNYATPLKQAAPESLICGPISCCWWYYWNSQAGPTDKQAHGGEDLLPWFLSQVRVHDQSLGQRTLDVLDIHYYPADVYSSDTSPAVAEKRLRSTQSLWNPSYVDESWINTPVYLIPRMKALIEARYPGTLFGISEWNWGADGTMNGALAIADVLGVYGREGVYLASYWRYPEQYSPGYYAFKMYTNYDGRNSFSGASVSAISDDQGQVSSYAALDSTGEVLRVMLINKNRTQEAAVNLDIAHFDPQETATLYRYSEANITNITKRAVEVSAQTALTLPPYSITLLVIKRATVPTSLPLAIRGPVSLQSGESSGDAGGGDQ